MSKFEKILLAANCGIYLSIMVISYAYVDLNLTLINNRFILKFIEMMQGLGYYHRQTATLIYLIIICSAFAFFVLNITLFYKKKVGAKYLAISTVANTLILIFSYPFLSYDIFNYMFDAKIILKYHSNPYTHRPLDFPQDEWLRFMRWVHRYSPYGPLWLAYSLIPATLGFGKFILNFLTFKIFIGVFHLINTYLIFKILGKINPNRQLVGTAFYSLNPTLLIEGVANAHNDIVLASFLIGAVYFLVFKKTLFSLIALLAGVLVKYIPVVSLPWLIWEVLAKKGSIQRFILFNLATIAIFTYIFSSFKIVVPFVSSGATQVQFQPWYLFWTIPFVALTANITLLILAISACFGTSLRYLPYLYYGDWSHQYTTAFMQSAILLPILISTMFLFLKRFSKNEKIFKI